MHIKLYIILVIGVLGFFGTNSCSLVGIDPDDIELVEMRVNHYKQTAIGVGPQLVYLVQEEEKIGDEDWNYFYDEIEGFEYESGYIYDLKVRKIKIQNPPQDASDTKFLLHKVMSKEWVDEDETFEIKLKWAGNNFVQNSGSGYSILNEYSIECAELCEELSQDLEINEELTGTFTHLGDNRLKLISIQ